MQFNVTGPFSTGNAYSASMKVWATVRIEHAGVNNF
jgi:hypothetical protein